MPFAAPLLPACPISILDESSDGAYEYSLASLDNILLLFKYVISVGVLEEEVLLKLRPDFGILLKLSVKFPKGLDEEIGSFMRI